MTDFDFRSLGKFATALLLGVALAGSPALAGNGNGNGGGAGNAGNGGGKGNGASHSQAGKDKSSSKTDTDTDTETDTDTTSDTTTVPTKSYGTINGFLHASANGLKHASANSAVGSVLAAYAAVAVSEDGTTTTTDGSLLQSTLQSFSKKTITKDMLKDANEQLYKAGKITDTQLAELNTTVDAIP